MEKIEGISLDKYIGQNRKRPSAIKQQLQEEISRIIDAGFVVIDTQFGENTLVTPENMLYFVDPESYVPKTGKICPLLPPMDKLIKEALKCIYSKLYIAKMIGEERERNCRL